MVTKTNTAHHLETSSCLPNQPAQKTLVDQLKHLAKKANLSPSVKNKNTPSVEAVNKHKKGTAVAAKTTKILIIGLVILIAIAIAYFLLRYIAKYEDNLDDDDSKV